MSKRPSPKQRARTKRLKQERLDQVDLNMSIPLSQVAKRTTIRTNGIKLGNLKGYMHQIQPGSGMGKVVIARKTYKPFSPS